MNELTNCIFICITAYTTLFQMSPALDCTILKLSDTISVYIPVFIMPSNTSEYSSNINLRLVNLFEMFVICLSVLLNYLIIRGISKTSLFHRNLCRIAQVLFEVLLFEHLDPTTINEFRLIYPCIIYVHLVESSSTYIKTEYYTTMVSTTI